MVNICIVGYGAIGPKHASALEKIEGVNFYAVCDVDSERVARCTEKYNVITYTDFDEMLEDKNIDAVHICTPHFLHFEMVKRALEKGKRIVCEKPLAINREEFDKMLKLPGIENVAVVFQNRLNTCVLKMREVLENESYGRIIGIRGLVTWKRDEAYYKTDAWRGKWETEGGGVLINQTIHTFDLISYLGGGIKSLKANMANYSLEGVIEVEDTFMAALKTKNDAKGIFFATNAFSSNSQTDVQVFCDSGVLHYTDSKLFINDELICSDVTSTGEKAYWGTGHLQLLRNFYENNKFFSVFDAENTMKAVFAMYKSAGENGAEVVVD